MNQGVHAPPGGCNNTTTGSPLPVKLILYVIQKALLVIQEVGLQHLKLPPHLEAAPAARHGVPQADSDNISKQSL